jgi:hypothetical protein
MAARRRNRHWAKKMIGDEDTLSARCKSLPPLGAMLSRGSPTSLGARINTLETPNWPPSSKPIVRCIDLRMLSHWVSGNRDEVDVAVFSIEVFRPSRNFCYEKYFARRDWHQRLKLRGGKRVSDFEGYAIDRIFRSRWNRSGH